MRISTFSELRKILDSPARVARWMDDRTGLEIYVRGYTLAERLAWKNERWAFDKGPDSKITTFNEESFINSVVIRTASWDPEGKEPLFPSLAAAMPQLSHSNEKQGLPAGIVTSLWVACQTASGARGKAEWVQEEVPEEGDRLARLRGAYTGACWFSGVFPLYPEAQVRVQPASMKVFMGAEVARRPADNAPDSDFGKMKLLREVWLNSVGEPLIPAEEADWVADHLPWGTALAIEDASAQAAGFASGDVIDFFPQSGSGSSEMNVSGSAS